MYINFNITNKNKKYVKLSKLFSEEMTNDNINLTEINAFIDR